MQSPKVWQITIQGVRFLWQQYPWPPPPRFLPLKKISPITPPYIFSSAEHRPDRFRRISEYRTERTNTWGKYHSWNWRAAKTCGCGCSYLHFRRLLSSYRTFELTPCWLAFAPTRFPSSASSRKSPMTAWLKSTKRVILRFLNMLLLGLGFWV